MSGKDSNSNGEEIEKKSLIQSNLTKRVATSAILIAVGIVLAMFNPFAFVEILGGPKVFPMAHFINGITGVLIGISFACVTSLGIAIFRIAATIANIISPVHLLYWWGLFAASSIPGSILGFLMLKLLKRQGISYKDFF